MATRKYDVYINNEGSLSLLKFPAMQSQLDNEPDNIHISLRPKSFKLKLEVDLNTGSQNFNLNHAEVIANKSVPNVFTNGIVDKNIYSSSKYTIDDGQLFVTRVSNNKMLCHPILNVLTMRSDLRHFDVKEETDIKEEVRPVSVKFAAPERSNQISKSPNIKEEPVDDTPDEEINLSYKPPISKDAETERLALFGLNTPKMKIEPDSIDQKPVIYLPDVKPKAEPMEVKGIITQLIGEPSSCEPSEPHNRPSQVKKLVKECLMKAKIVSFQELYEYIKSSGALIEGSQTCKKDILDALNEYAVLVQGNWAIKSDTLYRDSNQRQITDETGISLNLLIAARDYLIWLFGQDRFVSRMEYTKRVRIPDQDVLSLFKQLSNFVPDKRKWELKLPTDTEFLSNFPDVAQRQTTFWKVRKANKLNIFEPRSG